MFDPFDRQTQQRVTEALRLLEVEDLVLAIHDPSFPADPDDDAGRGTPYSRGARGFFEFARALGFTGVQLGPQGKTSATNPSPYDGTLFSRNPLNASLRTLLEEGLLSPRTAEALASERPATSATRVDHEGAFSRLTRALDEAYRTAESTGWERDAIARFGEEHRAWLERDALYDALCFEHGAGYFRQWRDGDDEHLDQRLFGPRPEEARAAAERRAALLAKYRTWLERERFFQFWVHREHEALRARLRGFKLYGDLQIGFSVIDFWAHRAVLLGGYRMGAPPSRTNPDGQPWNYQVLDPAQYGTAAAPGPVLELVAARMDKMFAEYDGVRIDHPHGLVCPWVYRAETDDPLRAVQEGARLFESPDLPDHPALAAYAIARPDQLETYLPRHSDGWVRELDEAQVSRYDLLFSELTRAAARHQRNPRDLVCEVLSTMPYPLRRVLERHQLGRFRVTQKADLKDSGDVYRSENATPADWIMVGNHDTPPLWRVLDDWKRKGTLHARADYLAERLTPAGEDRAAFAERLAADPGALAQAQFADLFASPARHVMVFFADLLGLSEVYNTPGTVGTENWSLRVPPGYRAEYPARAARNEAVNLPRALAIALRARGLAPELAAELERAAG